VSGEGILPNDPGADEDRATYYTFGDGGRRVIGPAIDRLCEARSIYDLPGYRQFLNAAELRRRFPPPPPEPVEWR
jgi:hypothetical protein